MEGVLADFRKAHPDVPVELDHKAALHQLMQTIVPGMSAFEGVRSLDPGHFLRIQRKNGRLARWISWSSTPAFPRH